MNSSDHDDEDRRFPLPGQEQPCPAQLPPAPVVPCPVAAARRRRAPRGLARPCLTHEKCPLRSCAPPAGASRAVQRRGARGGLAAARYRRGPPECRSGPVRCWWWPPAVWMAPAAAAQRRPGPRPRPGSWCSSQVRADVALGHERSGRCRCPAAAQAAGQVVQVHVEHRQEALQVRVLVDGEVDLAGLESRPACRGSVSNPPAGIAPGRFWVSCAPQVLGRARVHRERALEWSCCRAGTPSPPTARGVVVAPVADLVDR